MIYTNIESLNLKLKTKSYEALGDSFKDWIETNTVKLYKGRTEQEEKASKILKELKEKFEPQCFFFDSESKKLTF